MIEALHFPPHSENPVFADGEPSMREALLDFLQGCAEASRLEDEVGRSLLRGRDLYAAWANDSDLKTGELAAQFLAFCGG